MFVIQASFFISIRILKEVKPAVSYTTHVANKVRVYSDLSLHRTQKAVRNWNLTGYMFTLKILSFVKSLFNETNLKPETRSTDK